jgi:hypothetical protein
VAPWGPHERNPSSPAVAPSPFQRPADSQPPSPSSKPSTSTAQTRSAFKAAARAVTVPKPAPRKTGKRQGGGDAFSTAWIVQDYLDLCRDPLSDLQRWLDEDKKKPSLPRASRQNQHAANATTLAVTRRLPRNTLPEMSGRVRAEDNQRRDNSAVSGGSRTGIGRYRELQQVQAERDLGRADASPVVGMGDVSAIAGYYASLIAAARSILRPHEAAATIRNLIDEKTQAVRAAKSRQKAVQANPSKPGRPRDYSILPKPQLG